jgi:hypothetical protein
MFQIIPDDGSPVQYKDLAPGQFFRHHEDTVVLFKTDNDSIQSALDLSDGTWNIVKPEDKVVPVQISKREVGDITNGKNFRQVVAVECFTLSNNLFYKTWNGDNIACVNLATGKLAGLAGSILVYPVDVIFYYKA